MVSLSHQSYTTHLIVGIPPDEAMRLHRHCLTYKSSIAAVGRAAVAEILARPAIGLHRPGDPSGISRIGIPLALQDEHALRMLARRMRLPMTVLVREGLRRVIGGVS